MQRSYQCFNSAPEFRSATTQRKRIVERAIEAKAEIKEALKGARRVSIALDEWSARTIKHSFLAIKAYWIDESWRFYEELLGFPVIKGRHTGENFSNYVRPILEEYDLLDRLVSMTTDNAGNNGTMFDKMYVPTSMLPYYL